MQGFQHVQHYFLCKRNYAKWGCISVQISLNPTHTLSCEYPKAPEIIKKKITTSLKDRCINNTIVFTVIPVYTYWLECLCFQDYTVSHHLLSLSTSEVVLSQNFCVNHVNVCVSNKYKLQNQHSYANYFNYAFLILSLTEEAYYAEETVHITIPEEVPPPKGISSTLQYKDLTAVFFLVSFCICICSYVKLRTSSACKFMCLSQFWKDPLSCFTYLSTVRCNNLANCNDLCCHMYIVSFYCVHIIMFSCTDA